MTTKKSQTPFFIMIALALIGVGISVYLSQHYFEVRSGSAGFKSFCNIGSSFNCDAVAASRYAEIFPGAPLSAFGTGWLLGILAVAAFGMTNAWSRVASRILIAMSSIGVLTSLFYLFIMMARLHTYCLFCLILDGVNVLLLATSLSLLSKSRSGAPASAEDEKSAWKTLGITVLACLFVGIVATKGMDSGDGRSEDVDLVAESIFSAPELPVTVKAGAPSIGPKDAPITIVEFSDFQCPYCRMAAMQLNTVLNRYPDKIRLVFRYYPLDMSCNPKVNHPMHTMACEAARVAYCANLQGKFLPVYEDLFQNQESLKPGYPAELAVKNGVNPSQLDACVKSPEVQAGVLADIEEGSRLNVNSTPTMFINGHKFEGAPPLKVWDKIVEQYAKSSH